MDDSLGSGIQARDCREGNRVTESAYIFLMVYVAFIGGGVTAHVSSGNPELITRFMVTATLGFLVAVWFQTLRGQDE